MAIELEVTAPNGVLQTIYKWANVCRWKYTSLTGFGKFDGFVCMPPNQGRSITGAATTLMFELQCWKLV